MILIPNQTQSAVTPCASGRLQWFGPNMPPRITIFPETWPYQNLRPFFILKSFITWDMHWRRNHSGYWISFQTHKENIFQSWNENLINVSRSSYKCTFYFLIGRTAWKSFPNSAFLQAFAVYKEYFLCGCFGTDMLFSKLDTFYGPAASYIQFPNTHISILKKQGHLCFHSLKRLFKFLL